MDKKIIKITAKAYAEVFYDELRKLTDVLSEDHFKDSMLESELHVQHIKFLQDNTVKEYLKTYTAIESLCNSDQSTKSIICICATQILRMTGNTIYKIIISRIKGTIKTVWSLAKFKVAENLDILSKFFWIH